MAHYLMSKKFFKRHHNHILVMLKIISAILLTTRNPHGKHILISGKTSAEVHKIVGPESCTIQYKETENQVSSGKF